MERLLGTGPQVIKRDKTEKSYKKHLKYRDIRKVYREGGSRKDPLALGNSELLCPTLTEFNKSGLGPKFLEKDLSFSKARSVNSSFVNSPRKSEMSMRYSQQVFFWFSIFSFLVFLVNIKYRLKLFILLKNITLSKIKINFHAILPVTHRLITIKTQTSIPWASL